MNELTRKLEKYNVLEVDDDIKAHDKLHVHETDESENGGGHWHGHNIQEKKRISYKKTQTELLNKKIEDSRRQTNIKKEYIEKKMEGEKNDMDESSRRIIQTSFSNREDMDTDKNQVGKTTFEEIMVEIRLKYLLILKSIYWNHFDSD
tara:strand:- start:115 stop:558 length:444 start_codon:yes stop_codon:yes gene_type:complete